MVSESILQFLNKIPEGLIKIVKTILLWVKDIIGGISTDFQWVILLGISLIAAYFLVKKSKLSENLAVIVVGLIIWAALMMV